MIFSAGNICVCTFSIWTLNFAINCSKSTGFWAITFLLLYPPLSQQHFNSYPGSRARLYTSTTSITFILRSQLTSPAHGRSSGYQGSRARLYMSTTSITFTVRSPLTSPHIHILVRQLLSSSSSIMVSLLSAHTVMLSHGGVYVHD